MEKQYYSTNGLRRIVVADNQPVTFLSFPGWRGRNIFGVVFVDIVEYMLRTISPFSVSMGNRNFELGYYCSSRWAWFGKKKKGLSTFPKRLCFFFQKESARCEQNSPTRTQGRFPCYSEWAWVTRSAIFRQVSCCCCICICVVLAATLEPSLKIADWLKLGVTRKKVLYEFDSIGCNRRGFQVGIFFSALIAFVCLSFVMFCAGPPMTPSQQRQWWVMCPCLSVCLSRESLKFVSPPVATRSLRCSRCNTFRTTGPSSVTSVRRNWRRASGPKRITSRQRRLRVATGERQILNCFSSAFSLD